MTAPSKSQSASPPASGSGAKDGFYLQPRTKIVVLGICVALMIGASVYAVLQPLNRDPQDASLSARFWYPRETNPYARLQAVRCANDYACRLNSVAVSPTDEVWAVGNVGLVLHRRAGESRWEQLTITAREESAATPPARPTPTPTKPLATPTPTPTVTPTRSVQVPNLFGLRIEAARGRATRLRFQLKVEYEKGYAPDPKAQQGPPTDFVVIRQSPAAKTLAPAGSTITVTLGRPPKSAASLMMDALVPTVYAASRPAKEPKQQPTPKQSNAQSNQARAASVAKNAKGVSATQPSRSFPLDDDLIYVECSDKKCVAFGRSGRVYAAGGNEWSFRQAVFLHPNGDPIPSLSLQYVAGRSVVAKSKDATYVCTGRGPLEIEAPLPFVCKLLAPEGQKGKYGGFAFGVTSADGYTIPELVTPGGLGTTAPLRFAAFNPGEAKTLGFIVGDHGSILSTTDGGKTWRHETQGPEGAAPNHRMPALWYWVLAFVLIGLCSVVVAAPLPPPPTELSVADWTVTDAPLKPGDVDSLGFTPMALGLSRFIRNPKTQPPVTIAIEGEWGEGKSSVMGLLRGDLEKSRFRPVWFNAWHHQSEEQLLAALLEHIKSQAIPPWWHVDNWIFRARLLRFRFRGKWPLLILLLLGLCGGVAYGLSRYGLKAESFVNFGTGVINFLKYLLTFSKQGELPDLEHFGVVATMTAMFAAIFRQARAFGINPAKLTDNLRAAATIKDIKHDPGVRPRFAREFGDVCKAWSWGGRRVIIFIDDLDRCRPESVVTVLESINFLTTAGDCMIVLGMAEKQVTHAVGLGFKEIALAEENYRGGGTSEHEKAIARFNYGTLYIKKLVNIVAPLPKTTPEQRRHMLEAQAEEVRRQAEDEERTAARAGAWRTRLWDWANEAGRMALKAAPVFALVLAVVLSVFIGYKEGIQQKGQNDNQPKTAAGAPVAAPVPAPQPTPETLPGAAAPLAYERPTSEPATLVEPGNSAGSVWWTYAWDVLFLVIIFGIFAYQLSARTNQDAQNSPEFEDSLKLWGQYIVGVCDTPREIKRALNDLRYQAMTRRRNGPSTTRAERLIRAIRQFVTGRAEKGPVEVRVDEAALPPRKAAELASLTEEELKAFLDPDKLDMKGSENLQRLIRLKRQHIKHFQRWIGDVRPATEAITQGAENRPPAQAAHQA